MPTRTANTALVRLHNHRTGNRHQWQLLSSSAWLALAVAVFATLLGIVVANSWHRLVFALIAASAFNSTAFSILRRAERRQISIKFLFVVHAVQAPLILIIMAMFVPAVGFSEFPFDVLLEHPFATAVGLITVPLSILTIA